jgi:hypothetical protein
MTYTVRVRTAYLGELDIPSFTTATLPTPGTGGLPAIVWDSTVGALKVWNGTTWVVGAGSNLSLQVSSAGVQPGATAADNVVANFTIPAGYFSAAGRSLKITAAGSYGATANTKTVKIIVNPASATIGSTVGGGGVTIATTGANAANGGGFSISGSYTKYGAAASNTQIGVQRFSQVNAVAASTQGAGLVTATESGTILVAITANAATATTDITFNWLEVVAS